MAKRLWPICQRDYGEGSVHMAKRLYLYYSHGYLYYSTGTHDYKEIMNLFACTIVIISIISKRYLYYSHNLFACTIVIISCTIVITLQHMTVT